MSSEKEIFGTIVDPETDKEVGLNTEIGKQIIQNYIEAVKNGVDSENIISTKKFYSNELNKNNTKKSEIDYEKYARRLTSQQFSIEELVNLKYCGDPSSEWNVREKKIVWTRRSSGKWQLGIIGKCNLNELDIYFNNGDSKIGFKKGLKIKDLLPTTARMSKLLQ